MAALLPLLPAGEAVCSQPSYLPREQQRVREVGVQSRIWQGCNIKEIFIFLVVLKCCVLFWDQQKSNASRHE